MADVPCLALVDPSWGLEAWVEDHQEVLAQEVVEDTVEYHWAPVAAEVHQILVMVQAA